MSATATIKIIYCVQQATGTDLGVNRELAALPGTLSPAGVFGSAFVDAIQALPGVLGAIDTARDDPDNLYVVVGDTESGRDNAAWPGPGLDKSVGAGQVIAPDITTDFDVALNVTLWDYDDVSDDDRLGSVAILESEQGQGDLAKKAYSNVEGSVYYVVYSVE